MSKISQLKSMLYVLCFMGGATLGFEHRNYNKLDKLEQKIETVDSTLKSWDVAMQPMVAEANAKKTLVMKNFSDSIAKVAKQHQMDSLENVVRQLKTAIK